MGHRDRQATLWAAAAAVLVVTTMHVAATAPAFAGGTQDDGQPLFRIEGRQVTEASGIAVDPTNTLFYINQDAGNSNEVFVVDLTGRVRATVKVPTPNEDWEDVATGIDTSTGRRYVYLADTGDAYFTRRDKQQPPRTSYAVVRLDAPTVGAPGTTVLEVARGTVRWPFVFADGETHNAESMAIQPGTSRIFVADKTERVGAAAYLWAGPAGTALTQNTFVKVAQIPVEGASGAAFSATGSRLVIRNANRAYVWTITNGDVGASIVKRPIVVPLPVQRQGEGVAFTPDGTALLLASEGPNSLVWQLPLPPDAVAQSANVTVSGSVAPEIPDGRLDAVAIGLSAAAIGAVVVLMALRQVHRRRRGA